MHQRTGAPVSAQRGAWLVVVWLLAASLPTAPAAAHQHVAAAVSEAMRASVAEVSRELIFAPLYGAIAEGHFAEVGVGVELTTTFGATAAAARVLAGEAEFAIVGPEVALFTARSGRAGSLKIVGALSNKEGMFLLSREPQPLAGFRWEMLRGKKILGWRPASTPGYMFEFALRRHGLDPAIDLDYQSDHPVPTRFRLWREGAFDFAPFYEPYASQYERMGLGYSVASVGQAVGSSVYSVVVASEALITARADLVQRFVSALQRGLEWVRAADPEAVADVLMAYLDRVERVDVVSGIKRYRSIEFWNTDLSIAPEAIVTTQTMLIESGVMRPNQRVPYDDLVDPTFAEQAKRAPNKR